MNRYPLWKYLLVVGIVVLGFIFAMPNLFGDSPAVQVTQIGSTTFPASALSQADAALAQAGITTVRSEAESDKAIIVFSDSETQLKASKVIQNKLGDDYSVALNLVPGTPDWMQSLGLKPMAKGLDLVGGIYFRLKVDIKGAVNNALENQMHSIQSDLRNAGVHYSSVSRDHHKLKFTFNDSDSSSKAESLIRTNYPETAFSSYSLQDNTVLEVMPSSKHIQQIRDLAVSQNVAALRRRVNQLGVAEPIVQQQGSNYIVVELPGMRNAARAKQRLGDTATVQFRMVYQGKDPAEAKRTGRIPLDAQLFESDANGANGAPILLNREIVASGPEITDATSGFDQQSGTPDVNVTLNSSGASRMGDTTRHHLGDPMAVLYIQNHGVTKQVDGRKVETTEQTKKVINVSTIRGVFSSRFQITGLSREEAKSLALTLRTPLAAPITIAEERTIGPSMGADNIRHGLYAVVLGFILVVVGMAIYYKSFGLIADAAIIMNLILIVALLSLLQATLTLPGIAGMVLTVGMAVDANVLINERIREEVRVGSSPQAAIEAGYKHAMTAIVDANITTLIAALVLFTVGSGPIKGFAVVLSLGIVTSLFTAIMGTRAIVNLVYGGRRLKRLPV
jgi:preprotein translocase subunit SecD